NGDNVVSIGDHIQYTFSVVNIGDLDIENLVINDATIGVNGLVPVPSHLSPNHKVTATATYAITQADIDAGGVWNLATVNGEDPFGTSVKATSKDPNPLDPTDPSHPGIDPDCPDCTITPLNPQKSIALNKSGQFVDKDGNGKADVG